ncbi:hypothetical protein EUGRSUZ_F03725 [Eucalyptus grandis]|nr:hypothetical protein EUGRSUZ_F03725 [Eucalyptus grandis]
MLQAPMTDGSAQASSMSADAAAAQSNGSPTELMEVREVDGGDEDKDLRELLMPDVRSLPLVPPSAVESNFVAYFAPDFMKPGHDQYVYRHPNGLCVVGLARTHVAFRDEGGVTGVDFNVGKSDRSAIKVTGKRKKNAQHFESNTILCKVCTKSDSYVVR